MLLPNSECKLLDDDGKEVPEGQPGEMFIRGPQICAGYWRNERATKEALSPDGWLKTGDVAITKDGWLWIVDRKKVDRAFSVMQTHGHLLIDSKSIGAHKSQRSTGSPSGA